MILTNQTSDYQKQFYEQNKENLEFINEDNIPESHKTYLPVLSLSNTVKYHNPVVLVDEAHKFQGDNAQSCLQLLNPKFIIELSATPLLSQSNNTISEVHGIELWNESMIKLPIQYDSITNSNKSTAWTQLLNKAIAQLDDLQNCASNGNESMYVRPIMVVRTDYIDEKKKAEIKVKKPDAIFPSDVIQYLKSNGFGEQQIRIKTSITNEIKQENLLSKNCPVRVIITKDALKEGWDCSFAYVLVNLVKPSSRAKGLITQLVGRVLRQPYAKRFKQAELNSCYVFYNESEDGVDLYEQIRNELCAEQGLDGIDNLVVSINKNNVKSVPKPNNKKLVNRNANFTSLDLLLPKITNNGREIDYYRDIYPKVDFNNFSLTQSALTKIQIEYNNCLNNPWYNYKKIGYTTNTQTNSIYKLNDVNDFEAIGFLSEIILNPFVASKIWGDIKIMLQGYAPPIKNVIDIIVEEVGIFLVNQSKKIFEDSLNNGSFMFSVATSEKFILPYNWESSVDLSPSTNKSIFDKYKPPNQSEALFANEAEGNDFDGWYKFIEKEVSSYYIKGWNKNYKTYPDFILLKNVNNKVYIVETKGKHLIGNADTIYKTDLFAVLNNTKPKCQVGNEQSELIFNLVDISNPKILRNY